MFCVPHKKVSYIGLEWRESKVMMTEFNSSQFSSFYLKIITLLSSDKIALLSLLHLLGIQ